MSCGCQGRGSWATSGGPPPWLLPAPATMRRLVPLRGLVSLIAGLLAALLLLASDQASAQIPQDEQTCIVGLNKGFAKVGKAQGRENARCVKAAGRGKVASAEACLTADSRGKVSKAKSRNERGQASRCTGVTPPFGATDTATGNQVAVLMELDLLHDIFGSDLDAAIIDASDRAGANCQVAIAKLASKCMDAKLKQFNKCTTGGLDDGSIGDASGLEACMRNQLQAAIKVYAACVVKPVRRISAECATTDIAAASPGECSGAADPPELSLCLDRLVGCNVFRALGQIDALNIDCDAYPWLPRVLVIGLDSGDWDYLNPLMASGHTPTIRDLVSSGVKADYDCSLTLPGLQCFCPMVWTSIWTGHSSLEHGVYSFSIPPADRKVPAIWDVLRDQRPFQESLLVGAHNHVPPIPEATWIIPRDGTNAVGAARQSYDVWPDFVPVDPSQWSIPQGLFEDLGMLPHSGPTPTVWAPFAYDRVSMEAMKRILGSNDTPALSAFILHSIDKTMHLSCSTVMSSPDGPVNEPALLALADAWLGPVQGPSPFFFGNASSQYMEAEMHVRDLLDVGSWDYVMFTADHGMMLDPDLPPFPCQHVKPQGFDGIFALTGPGVRQGVELGTQNPLCTAPLLAYLLNLRISQTLPCVASGEFENSVLPDIFEPEHLAANPPIFIADW